MASGNITRTPDYTLTSTEDITNEKINRVGGGTFRVDEGSITNRELSVSLAGGFATVSAINANTDTFTDGDAIEIRGYYVDGRGDFGPPVYYDASDAVTADNGITCFVDANGARYKRTISGPINVLWAGAKNDGTADAASAINSSLLEGNDIYVPAGDYLVGSQIEYRFSGQTITGDGGGNTRLWKHSNIDLILMPSDHTRCSLEGVWCIGSHDGYGETIYDITAWATVPAARASFTDTTHGLVIGDAPGVTLGPADCVVGDCRFFNFGKDGIHHVEGPRLTLRNTSAYYNARWGYWSDYQWNVQAEGDWAATTAYTVGDLVLSSGGNIYYCTVAGTSSGTEPTHTSGTATDGTVTWKFQASDGGEANDTNHCTYDTIDILHNGLGSYTEGGNMSVGGAHNLGLNIKTMRAWGEGFRNKSRKSHYFMHDENNGTENSHIDAWVGSTAYSVGDMVQTTGDDLYFCTGAGTSHASTVPNHTSGTASDGTVTWQYRPGYGFYGQYLTDRDVKVYWLAHNGDAYFENGSVPYDQDYFFENASTGQNNNHSQNKVVTAGWEISRRAQRSMSQYGISSGDSFKNLTLAAKEGSVDDFEYSTSAGTSNVNRVIHDDASGNNYLQFIAGSNNRFWWSQLVYGLRPETSLVSANWSNFNDPIGERNYVLFDVSSGNLVADLYNNTLLGSSDDDARGLLITLHRVTGTNQLRIRTTDGNSPPDMKILGLDGTVYTSGSTAGYDLNSTNNIIATTLMYVGSDNPITTSIDASIRWVEVAQLRGPQAAETDLNQTISGSYTQSEVQDISDKVDALLQKLRDHGILA